jgi:hypothetical protein
MGAPSLKEQAIQLWREVSTPATSEIECVPKALAVRLLRKSLQLSRALWLALGEIYRKNRQSSRNSQPTE